MNMKQICIFTVTVSALVLVACGGGANPVVSASTPTQVVKASVPTPAKKATIVAGGNGVVIHMYQALYGMAPSNALLVDYAFQANNDASTFVKNLTDRFAVTSHADLAKLVLDNLGVTPTSVPAINSKGEIEYSLLLDAVTQVFGAFPAMRGQVILNMTGLLTELEADATYGSAALGYNTQTKRNFSYSSNAANIDTRSSSSQDVVCSVPKNRYSEVAYPPAYRGSYSLPTPTQTLPKGIVRMMDMKDYYPYVSPSISGCSDTTLYARHLYEEELDRMRDDGAEVVWVTNYGPWVDLNQVPWTIASLQIPDADFAFLIGEIKKRGMKAYFYWQMWGVDTKGNEYPMGTNLSMKQLQNWMLSHRQLMINLSKLSANLGIDGLGVDWQAYYIPNLYEADMREYYISTLTGTIDEIKKNFSGKLIMGLNGHLFSDARLMSRVDYMRLSLAPQISLAENSSLTVSILKDKFLDSIKLARQQLGDLSIYGNAMTVELQFAIQSRDKYFVDGWVEDGFCAASFGDSCIQKTYKTDYSVQAIGLEAAFEAAVSQTYFNVGAVTSGAFWHTDSTAPGNYGSQSDFPNLSASVRNKPAESILRYWYMRN